MKKTIWTTMGLSMVLLSACSEEESSNQMDLEQDWTTIEEQAAGDTVNVYMWGGSDSINRYFDEWVTPLLQQDYDIELNRVPVSDTQEILTQLLDEKAAGKNEGSMDVLWINGENFKNAKENELLWQSFADVLPNVEAYVNQQAPQIAYDFGIPVDGLQAPWGTAQFVMVYDEERVNEIPTSVQSLAEWVEQNPGKFTYPAPPEFTGSAFVRQAMHEIVGSEPFLSEDLTREEVDDMLQPLWTYLNGIEPYLWRNGETYPESLARLDQLYTAGEVSLTMAYDPIKASAEIQNGRFPETTKTFVFDGGTLSNTHYLAIPFNTTNPEAALVAINALLSPEAQAAKLDPANWGDLPAIDLTTLDESQTALFTSLDLGSAALSLEELEANRIPEIPAKYVEWIEEGWQTNVAEN